MKSTTKIELEPATKMWYDNRKKRKDDTGNGTERFDMICVLYEDQDIIICEKKPGMLSEESDAKESLPRLLKKEKGGEFYTLHRLDKPVGGAIVYAKNKKAAAAFSRLIAGNGMTKEYCAVIDGVPDEEAGEWRDLLFKDSRRNKTYVVNRMRKGVREAILQYRVLRQYENRSLVAVKLITGRSHQIRAQFASRKMPLTGDGKYGSRDNNCSVALWSHELSFTHPLTGDEIRVVSEPPFDNYPWNLFRKENEISVRLRISDT